MITQLISVIAIVVMTLFYLMSEENSPVTETAKLRIITDTVDISHILLTSNDQLKFDHKEIRVREWEKVRITLKHKGVISKEIQGHNFVLLADGTDIHTFVKLAERAGSPGLHSCRKCYCPH